MTYLRFAGSKLTADGHARSGHPTRALRTLIDAIVSEPRLFFRKSMYLKMGSSLARGGWNKVWRKVRA
jgi:hypothetical protein